MSLKSAEVSGISQEVFSSVWARLSSVPTRSSASADINSWLSFLHKYQLFINIIRLAYENSRASCQETDKMGVMKHISFCLPAVLVFLAACPAPAPLTEPAAVGEEEEAGEELSAGSLSLVWEQPAFSVRGLISQVQVLEYIDPSSNFWGLFCFENNNPCVRAAPEIRKAIKNNPVAIHGFRLNLKAASGTTVTLNSAEVTTARLELSASTGNFVFSDRRTQNLIGAAGSCSLSDVNSIGLPNPQVGQERVLTGLYLYDEASPGSMGDWSQAHMHAARVWYSGLKPAAPAQGQTFAFSFDPLTEPAEADFGFTSFVESGAGIVVSPYFGVSERYATDNSIVGWSSHVVIGFCINGTKSTSETQRPAFLGVKTRTYKPVVKLNANN